MTVQPTAQAIIFDALCRLGAYSPSETLQAADAALGLSVLNDMVDSWSNENLTCYAISEQSAPLQVGVNAYTIGSGGTFNMTRPLRLIEGPGAAYIQDSNGNNYSVDVVPRDQWNRISNRSTSQTTNVPDTLFYDPQFPLGIINFSATPNSGGYTAFWDSYLQFTEFASLSSVTSLPPGYAAALKSNLAVALKPYYQRPDVTLDPALVREALQAKGNIKRTNQRTNVAVFDPGMSARPKGTFDIYSYGYTR